MFTVQLKLFFTLLAAIFFELPITWTFFDFPWRSELLGVDCTSVNKLNWTEPSPIWLSKEFYEFNYFQIGQAQFFKYTYLCNVNSP